MGNRKNNKTSKQQFEKNTSTTNNHEYCFQMKNIGTNVYKPHWLELIPVSVLTAIIILIMYMHRYEIDPGNHAWLNETSYVDFYSYFKMIAILVCAIYVVLVLLYRLVNQTLAIKKSKIYILTGVYALFIIVSYILLVIILFFEFL